MRDTGGMGGEYRRYGVVVWGEGHRRYGVVVWGEGHRRYGVVVWGEGHRGLPVGIQEICYEVRGLYSINVIWLLYTGDML